MPQSAYKPTTTCSRKHGRQSNVQAGWPILPQQITRSGENSKFKQSTIRIKVVILKKSCGLLDCITLLKGNIQVKREVQPSSHQKVRGQLEIAFDDAMWIVIAQ